MALNSGSSKSVLLCRSGQQLYALPLASVRETMRALPAEPVPAMPDCLLGVSLIRGAAVPVVDGRRLVGAAASESAPASRYVSLVLGERQVALAVDAVLGVRRLDAAMLAEVAPLLDGAETGMVQAISILDAELLMVLQASCLVPEALWDVLAQREGAA
ncbi:chemotaxis protein CheW [Massilia sp. BJB1822]|uniref:chemotaxis protein CheW n=1 Tax=Massilia sp. BJB1822 TaxID=2744470 RepID=UPI0015936F36|nr:chemotaxis protein CheW [Massilia sp. BJB1822]NVD97771.1 chemotaxis protein CheW [Massilia sp. BJB1822]